MKLVDVRGSFAYFDKQSCSDWICANCQSRDGQINYQNGGHLQLQCREPTYM